jgi:hypothetical protein
LQSFAFCRINATGAEVKPNIEAYGESPSIFKIMEKLENIADKLIER